MSKKKGSKRKLRTLKKAGVNREQLIDVITWFVVQNSEQQPPKAGDWPQPPHFLQAVPADSQHQQPLELP